MSNAAHTDPDAWMDIPHEIVPLTDAEGREYERQEMQDGATDTHDRS